MILDSGSHINARGERRAQRVRSTAKLDVPSVTRHDYQNNLSCIMGYSDEFAEITENPTSLVPGARNFS